ncbi:sel1 repeat family protein [Streptomyces antioxidans]|uniref:tetratricopeptide repeat protein n=1 Tax=Streptomyces TaxID=1883 RepID=UPI000B15F706|nr:sel1 repeat family protein [Streptomyces antioxidans]
MVEHSSQDAAVDPEAEAARLRAAAAIGKPGAYRAYAELLTGRGRLDEALPWWARAADAGDADASRALAICHKDRGEFAEAERWYRTAADRDGGCAFGLARLLHEAGDTAGAERWYEHGAALGSVECKTNGAVLLAARGAWDTALERLAEASAEGDDVATHSRRAIQGLLRDLDRWRADLARAEADGDPEEAYEALRELLGPERKAMFERYPGMVAEAEALYARAAAVGGVKALVDQALFIARDDSRWAEARALVERAHERGYDGAAYVLGVWAEENGELRTAEEWYRTADAADGGHLWARFNLGVLCMRQRRLAEAERWLRAAGADGADGADDVGGVDEGSGPNPFGGGEERVVAALRDIAAIRADPERMPPAEWEERLPGLRARAEEGGPDAWFAYADALDRLYRLPEAAEWYREAGTPRALLALGRMLYEAGGARGVRMVPYYEPAAAEGDAGAAYDIGRIHDEAGDRRTAQIWFRRAADLGHGRAAWWLGWTSEEYGGDPQHAERWYVRAARSGLVPPAFLAGRSMVRRGACAEAEPLLRVACEGEHEEAPYWLARALRGLGRTEEAARAALRDPG